ncbi:MAG: tetratricopeptide repeat protein [Pseudomonadota bacterium]|nr:tetratricopeptide repeat protein [Pseudomonadota bacterium]
MIAAIATSTWVVFTFFARKSEKGPSAPSVKANHGSVVAVRDIIGPVTIGLDQKGVGQELEDKLKPRDEKLDKILAQVGRDKRVEIAPLRSILVKLGEAGVKDEDIPKRLDEKADELVKLRAKVDALQQGSPGLAAIAQEAQALIDKGDLDGASRTLALRREASQTRRIDASREDAEILALEAGVDDLQLAYRTAAAKYAEAASLVAPFDTEQQWRFLLAQASELYKQGDEFGDNAALIEAIDICRRCLALAPRSERPLDWAMTQMNLGTALKALGERESGTARLEEAAAAYREASQERTRARVPLDWAMTQTGLGNALQELGERESGTARLTEAVAAYREALQELTRARVPLEWALTQNNLGNALRVLGERENGTARLTEAVAAFREALQERIRARVPRDWARTQVNLGVALKVLGGRESGTARLEEAVSAYREALQEFTRARVPLDWAATQNNLGNALMVLGGRESGTARLEEAVSAFREALQELTRARVPLDWAFTQMNLALVYRAFFDKDHQPHHLDDALEAADGALEEFRAAKAGFYIEKAERQRGEILVAKGKL